MEQKSLRRRLAALLLMLCLLAAGALPALATSANIRLVDASGNPATGTIRVALYDSAKDKALSGGQLTLYRVAEVKRKNGDLSFEYCGDFYGCGIALGDLTDSTLADQLLEYMPQGARGTTKTVDADGNAAFEDLELGLYLIVQSKASNGYAPIKPFLVSLPMAENGKWNYEVDASPKVGGYTPVNPDTPPVPPTPVPDKPGTPSGRRSHERPAPDRPAELARAGAGGQRCAAVCRWLGAEQKGSAAMRQKIGKICMVLGALLILAAAALLAYNKWDAARADKAAQQALGELEQTLTTTVEEKAKSETVVLQPELDPAQPMTETELDGWSYIGYLSIPSIGLDLPVMSEWSYAGLKIAPGRYSGSTYADNMVVCAHNYAKHFSPIKWLAEGSQVYFTDMDGMRWSYEVSYVENLQPTQIEKMTEKTEDSDNWDLTLFTCTTGGRARCAVRCVRTGYPVLTMETAE